MADNMSECRVQFGWERREQERHMKELSEAREDVKRLQEQYDRLYDTYENFANAMINVDSGMAIQMFDAVDDEEGMKRCVQRD